MQTQAFLPIAELSAYQSRWTIKARVTNKAPLRTFKKGAGEGQVFHVDLLDAEQSDIRASFFNDAARRYHGMIEAGKCYTFTNGTVKVANKQFNRTSHRYEITFDHPAVVVPAQEDIGIKAVKFSFVDLRTVQTKQLPYRFDLCGVITGFRQPVTLQSKDGRELLKRDITVADETATSMEVALWGDAAKMEDAKFEGNPVIGMKGVLVKEWNGGRSGSLGSVSDLVFSPEAPECERIRRWWQNGGATSEIATLSAAGGGGRSFDARVRESTPCSLSELKQLAEKVGMEPLTFSTVARLAIVQTRKQGEQQPLHYSACAEQKPGTSMLCNRRVDAGGFCASCGRAGKTAVRLNARCRYVDFGESLWLTSFHEAAQQVIAMKGEEVEQVEASAPDGKGRELLEAQLQQRYFAQPLQLVMRAKLDSYNGDIRTNIVCADARPVSRQEHGRTMLKEIQSMLEAGAA